MTGLTLGFIMPGPTEMIIVGIIGVILFGSRLPKLAYDCGNSFTQFKRGLAEPIQECAQIMEKETKDFHNTVGEETRKAEAAARNA
jgi:TatA/E family protein of Tat protein translocase